MVKGEQAMRLIWVATLLILSLTAACGGSGDSNTGKAAAPATVIGAAAAANTAAGKAAAPTSSTVAPLPPYCAKDPKCAAGYAKSIDLAAVAGKRACTLVTQAEAGAVLGKPANPGAIKGSVCTYEDAEGSSVTIDVNVEARGGVASKAQFAESRKGGSSSLFVVDDVPGLGDGAFIWTALGTIHVLSGATYFTIQLVNEQTLSNDMAAQRPALIALARTALTRV